MEEIRSTMEDHMNQMADLIQKISGELRSSFAPARDNFIGFFHAIDWKEPWLMGLLGFHFLLLVMFLFTRKNVNFQMCLFLLALSGVFLAERLNRFLGNHWQSFATQNYFDPLGVFLSVLWSGPLLIIAMLILVNTLFSLCHLIVRWKRAELKHRARLAEKKTE
ncbi:hypothetical protein RND81_01G214200 [Saponaria officinalis]|uniref:Transmembrane protein 18 n=1 Tax=Saponaria officinalis TaxID=3572 RepID=A0AAW1NH36_SAPOF